MSFVSLTSAELRSRLVARYPFATFVILDSTYNVPTLAAIDTFSKELSAHLFSQYGDKWQDYFDCDNFAIEALALAARKHWVARQAGSGSAEGIAFGVLGFLQTPGVQTSGHCVNFFLDEQLELHEYEPQTRQIKQLTKAQCDTAFFCLV